jgi:hypothetical protein
MRDALASGSLELSETIPATRGGSGTRSALGYEPRSPVRGQSLNIDGQLTRWVPSKLVLRSPPPWVQSFATCWL